MVLKSGFCDLGFAKVDIDRKKRRGYAEAIYSPGKSREHLRKISRELIKNKQDLLLTRLDKNTFSYLKKSIPGLKYNPKARLGFLIKNGRVACKGLSVVICAGTSDIPVAEEAAAVLEVMGNKVVRLFDVVVAGVHRIMQKIEVLKKARAIVVVAGME